MRGSLDEPAALRAAADGADAVLHMAAVTHARRHARYESVNVRGTERLIAATAAAGVKRFVFVSTRAATTDGGGYAASKLEAERLVEQSGLDYVIVRVPEMTGVGASEGIDDIVARARAGRPIPLIGDGEQDVYPVAVDDVVPAIVAAMREPVAARKRYVLGGERMTMREFAHACIAAYGSSSRIIRVPVMGVRVASVLARYAPLPLYPDQLARLLAQKDPPTPEAASELGFQPRMLVQALKD